MHDIVTYFHEVILVTGLKPFPLPYLYCYLFVYTGNLPWLDGVLANLLKPSHAYSHLHTTALELVRIRRNEDQKNVSSQVCRAMEVERYLTCLLSAPGSVVKDLLICLNEEVTDMIVAVRFVWAKHYHKPYIPVLLEQTFLFNRSGMIV